MLARAEGVYMTDQATTPEASETVTDVKSTTTDAPHVHTLGVGNKCSECDSVMLWSGYSGGAKTFADWDQYNDAQRVQGAVEGEMSVFDMISSNIRSDTEMDARAKAQAIQSLAGELDTRLAAAAADAEAENAGQRAVTNDPGMMTAFKDNSGNWRWFAIHTNRYEDRAREIFPEAAHKAFVEQAYRTKQFPTLRLFHVPYDIGMTDVIDYTSEGFMVSSGTFTPGMEDIAERLAGMKGLGCSHGFLYSTKDFHDGVYERYRTFEVTVLPHGAAANLLTAYFAGEEVPVAMNKAQRDFLTEVAGSERVALIERGLEGLKAYADEQGIRYKALEETILEQRTETQEAPVDTTTTATEEQAPAAVAAATPPGEEEQEPAATAEAPAQPAADEPPTVTDEEADEAQKAMAAAAPNIDFIEGMKAAFAQANAPLVAQVEALQQEVAGLKATRDEQMADAIRPKIGPTTTGVPSSTTGAAPTEAESEAVKAAQETPPAAEIGGPVGGYIQDLMQIAGRGTNGATAMYPTSN